MRIVSTTTCTDTCTRPKERILTLFPSRSLKKRSKVNQKKLSLLSELIKFLLRISKMPPLSMTVKSLKMMKFPLLVSSLELEVEVFHPCNLPSLQETLTFPDQSLLKKILLMLSKRLLQLPLFLHLSQWFNNPTPTCTTHICTTLTCITLIWLL